MVDDGSRFRLRSYQEEMLDLSLQENIIVKMDTGSGKTAIAIARAEATLTICKPNQIVWMLAPAVELCSQHFETLQTQLPAYQVRLLVGSDGVDRWSDQKTWDAALRNIRIVISTYAVLNDALNNAFVRIENMSLLIFDEAHHCVKNYPGAALMRNWYHRTTERPTILGLSASIVDPGELEHTLDCRVVTPSRCRTDLLHHVNRPVLHYVRYGSNGLLHGPKLSVLIRTITDYDLTQDPWFSGLNDIGQAAFLTKDKPTSCLAELKALSSRCCHICDQFGPYVADWDVENSACAMIGHLEMASRRDIQSPVARAELEHLLKLLRPLCSSAKKRDLEGRIKDDLEVVPQHMSPKFIALVNFLENEWTENFTGLIFVTQRAIAHTLAYLLSKHKFSKANFRVQAFVGTSNVLTPTKRLIERVWLNNQKDTLNKFRSPQREINLIVSTEVLSEGVDVPQCHLVMCFDMPPRVVSYVQKRGRARSKDSKYILMLRDDEDDDKIRKWQKLEVDLDAAYEAEQRAWQLSMRLEERDDPVLEDKRYQVLSTGALLTLDNAVAKLNHVCQTLRSGDDTDARPQFAYGNHSDTTVSAIVTLPLYFPPGLRSASSATQWLTERMAKRDAAFAAVIQLHKAGLLNEHLLPLKEASEDDSAAEEFLTPRRSAPVSFCETVPRLKPWEEAARQLVTPITTWFALDILLQDHLEPSQKIEFTVLSPIYLPLFSAFPLYWNHHKEYLVSTKMSAPRRLNADEQNQMMELTDGVLRSASGPRMLAGMNDFPFGIALSSKEMAHWTDFLQGSILDRYRKLSEPTTGALLPGVVVHEKPMHGRHKYFFGRLTMARLDEDGPDEEVIEATVYPKRRDFTHHFQGSTDAYTRKHLLPLSECEIEPLSINTALISLFLPSVLRKIELALVARCLQTTLLGPASIRSLPILQSATTARKAREAYSYERAEFFGDTYVGYLTSVHLMREKPLWPEGYLTQEKGRRVDNDTFCNAALRVGLDRFLIADEFTGMKWRPPYNHELLANAAQAVEKVKSSKKMVADLVEATIGAAYLDGGHLSAVKCCEIYFPERSWTTPDQQAVQLFDLASDGTVHLETLEEIIAYKFTKPSLLLEAITASSFKGGGYETRSYERLEFLGDSVLGFLTVRKIYNARGKELPHQAMHSIKSAAVNSWILGFLCMEHYILEDRENVVMSASDDGTLIPKVEREMVKKHIWQSIKSATRTEKETKSLARFDSMHQNIRRALDHDQVYPWPLLSVFSPAKIFSDVIESILGAIYIDSQADHEVCDKFLEHIGLWKFLDRLIDDNVACMHPKELLAMAVGSKKIDYVYEEEDNLTTCRVLVEGVQVGGVSKGATKDIASCLAATEALEIEQKGMVFDIVRRAWKTASEEKLPPAGSNGGSDEVSSGPDEA